MTAHNFFPAPLHEKRLIGRNRSLVVVLGTNNKRLEVTMAQDGSAVGNSSEVLVSLADIASADHPAIMRAVEEILNNQDDPSLFSNFVSHGSSVE